MLADEMRKAAGDAIRKIGLQYKEQAFARLAAGATAEAKEMASVAIATVDFLNAVDKALKRAAEEEDA